MGRYPTKSAFRAGASKRGLRATGRAPDLAYTTGRRFSWRLGRNRLFFIPRHRANHTIGFLAAQIGASSANATKMACCTCDTSVLQSLGCARQADATAPVRRRHASERMRGRRLLHPTTRQIAPANSHFLITGDESASSDGAGGREGSLFHPAKRRRHVKELLALNFRRFLLTSGFVRMPRSEFRCALVRHPGWRDSHGMPS